MASTSTSTPANQRVTDPSRPLRILSLDGGGIKGYTSALILQRVCEQLKIVGNLTADVRPCEYFDLICGTSTGGLLAIMLGTLEMTIGECLEAYDEFAKKVFGKKPVGAWRKMRKVMSGSDGKALYSMEKMKEVMAELLRKKKKTMESLFCDENSPSLCKVMVCVTRVTPRSPEIFRSYPITTSNQANFPTCKIWEAACATCATPLYFDPITFGRNGEEWCGGDLHRINPINEALNEVRRVYGTENVRLGCVVSVGCGVGKLEDVDTSVLGFLKGAVEMIMDAEAMSRAFDETLEGTFLRNAGRYFRFSVASGMAEFKADDVAARKHLVGLADYYVGSQEIGSKVTACAKLLVDVGEGIQIVQERVPVLENSLLPVTDTCHHFIERASYQQTLSTFFALGETVKKKKRFVLHGAGGSGKTQIAMHFALSALGRVDVYWIRATDCASFIQDFAKVGRKLDVQAGKIDRATVEDDLSVEQLVSVRDQLEKRCSDWLLVLDDAGSLDDFSKEAAPGKTIQRFLPTNGRILITTRNISLRGEVAAVKDSCHVGAMSRKECIALMRESLCEAEEQDIDELWSDTEVCELLDALGGLPLALAQAAAFIRTNRVTLKHYAIRYKNTSETSTLLGKSVMDEMRRDMPGENQQSVIRTFRVSWDDLGAQNRLAQRCLSALAFFDRDVIHHSAIMRLAILGQEDEGSVLRAINSLVDRSLITVIRTSGDKSKQAYQVHPITHRLIFLSINAELRVELLHSTIDAYVEPLNSGGPLELELQREGNVLANLAHLISCVDRLQTGGENDQHEPSERMFDLYDWARLKASDSGLYWAATTFADGALRQAELLDPPTPLFLSPLVLLALHVCAVACLRAGCITEYVKIFKAIRTLLNADQPPVIWNVSESASSRRRDEVLKLRQNRASYEQYDLLSTPFVRPDHDNLSKWTERYKWDLFSTIVVHSYAAEDEAEFRDAMDRARQSEDTSLLTVQVTDFIHYLVARNDFKEAISQQQVLDELLTHDSDPNHRRQGRWSKIDLLIQVHMFGDASHIDVLKQTLSLAGSLLDEARRIGRKNAKPSKYDDNETPWGALRPYFNAIAPKCGCHSDQCFTELLPVFHRIVDLTTRRPYGNHEYNVETYAVAIFHIAKGFMCRGFLEQAAKFFDFVLTAAPSETIPLYCTDFQLDEAKVSRANIRSMASYHLRKRALEQLQKSPSVTQSHRPGPVGNARQLAANLVTRNSAKLRSIFSESQPGSTTATMPSSNTVTNLSSDAETMPCSSRSNSEQFHMLLRCPELPGPKLGVDDDIVEGISVHILMQDLEQLETNCKKWVDPETE